MSEKQQYIKKMIFIAFFAALTAIGAFMIIPIGIVPMTLQTVWVLLAGYVLGSKHGALSQLLYVSMGLVGLPVYSRGGAGLGHLLGPTGGYLFGFIMAAFVVGLFAHKTKSSWLWLIMIFFVGTVVIYACGIAQLALVTHMGLRNAMVVGGLLFLPLDSIKIILCAMIVRYVIREKRV
jgi:biotin transport system substrate-specific component